MAEALKKGCKERTAKLVKEIDERYGQCHSLYTQLKSTQRWSSDWYQQKRKDFERNRQKPIKDPKLKPNEWEQMLEKHYHKLNNDFLTLSVDALNKGIETEGTAIDLVSAEEATENYLKKFKPQDRIVWEEQSTEDSPVEAEMRTKIIDMLNSHDLGKDTLENTTISQLEKHMKTLLNDCIFSEDKSSFKVIFNEELLNKNLPEWHYKKILDVLMKH